MHIALGGIFIFLGSWVALLTYVAVKKKKRFSFGWPSYNLAVLSIFLIVIGIYLAASR